VCEDERVVPRRAGRAHVLCCAQCPGALSGLVDLLHT
jgi:hypothetical protein